MRIAAYLYVGAVVFGFAACSGEEDEGSGCDQPDPAADAAFELSVAGWSGMQAEIDGECVVDAVAVAAGKVTTTLTCELAGASEPASLSFAEAPEGEVDWDAGQMVRLIAVKNFEFATKQIVQLRRAEDDGLLAVVVAGGTDNNTGYAEAFLPLVYDYSQPCAPAGEPDEGTPAQIDLADPDGAVLHLISHHRGSLPIDAEHVYAVDAGRVAVGVSSEFPVSQDVLLRRVRTGG